MERLAVQKVVEIMRHPPALYWGVSAAAALCWGTSAALAKRGKNNNLRNIPRNRNRANPSVAFKRLRRKYAEKLRPFFEDLVYLAMAILNNLVGIFYWVLDCCYEGRPNPVRNHFLIRNAVSRTIEPDSNASKISEEGDGGDVYKPRRGAIMRLRTRLVKINSLRGRPQTCGCWGWVVDDLPMAKLGDLGKECEVSAHPEEFGTSNGCEVFETGVDVKQGCDEEFVKDLQEEEGGGETCTRPRWSECHCSECAMLLMPMSVAAGKLYVRCGDEEQRLQHGEEESKDGGVGVGRSFDLGIIDNAVSSPLARSLANKTLPNLLAECAPVYDSPSKDCSAVIFIHGLFSSSNFWFDTDIVPSLSEAIRQQHAVFAPDLLGCGRSPRPVDSLYTLADQIEAVERSVIQRHNLESFHLVGHSMGTIVALALAARCPGRVRSITLIAPVYSPGCLREDGQLAQLPCDAFFSYLNPFTLKGIRALTVCKYYNISRFLGHMFYSKHTYWVSKIHNLLPQYPRSFINDYLTNYHDAAWHITHNTLLAGTHAVIPALQKLQEFGHSILVIHGENDSSIQFRLAEEMSNNFSNIELVAVPERGHVDVVWGRAIENTLLIEKAILEGDKWWSNPR